MYLPAARVTIFGSGELVGGGNSVYATFSMSGLRTISLRNAGDHNK